MSILAPTENEIVSWVRSICVMAGVRSYAIGDGTIGLENVPMKYARVIDAMHQAIRCLASGDPLPRLMPAQLVRKRKVNP